MRSFVVKMSDGFPEHFVGLPVFRIHYVPEINPRLHFGLFHLEGC